MVREVSSSTILALRFRLRDLDWEDTTKAKDIVTLLRSEGRLFPNTGNDLFEDAFFHGQAVWEDWFGEQKEDLDYKEAVCYIKTWLQTHGEYDDITYHWEEMKITTYDAASHNDTTPSLFNQSYLYRVSNIGEVSSCGYFQPIHSASQSLMRWEDLLEQEKKFTKAQARLAALGVTRVERVIAGRVFEC